VALAVAGLFLANPVRASISGSQAGGLLTEILNANGDTSMLSTGTSGSTIVIAGVSPPFTGVTNIAINFQSSSETVTFDSTNFAFKPTVTVTAVGATAGSDAIVIEGANSIALTGTGTYGGGTTVDAGSTVIADSSSALGTGGVILNNGAELRGTGTVTLGNAVQFLAATNNATISATKGGTFTLNSLDAGNTADVTFGSTGNTGTVVIGNGTLSPNHASVTVAFGTLKNGGGLGGLTGVASSTTVDAGATLSVNDQSLAISRLFGFGAVTLGTKSSTALTLTTGTFDGVISGAGGVTINSSVTYRGANTYTGGTTLAGGAFLTVDGAGSLTGNIADGGEVFFERTSATTFGGAISGTGAVDQEGTAALTLTGNNTYAGGTFISTGSTLIAGSATALGTGGITIHDGGELRGTGKINLGNAIGFQGANNAILSAKSGGTLTLSGALNATGTSTLTFGSAGNTGTVVVAGSTTGSGSDNIVVAFGTLEAGGSGLSGLTSGASATTTVNAGATLAANDHNLSINDLEGSGAVTLGKNASTVLDLADGTFSGVISGKGGVSVFISNFNLTLSGANTYTGGTVVGGELTLGGAGSLVGNIDDIGTLVFDRTSAYTFGGVISDGGRVVQEGPGVLTLKGNNTYSGGTIITAGRTLIVASSTALGTGPVTLATGSELRGMGPVALASGNTVKFGPGTTGATLSAASGSTFTINSLDTTNTTHLTFGSAGNTGTVIIANSVTATSIPITVAFGTLENGGGLGVPVGGLSALTSKASSVTVNTGATLAVNDLPMTTDDLEGTGAVTLGKKSSTVLTIALAQGAQVFGGVISGAGQLNLNATNSNDNLQLTGANTYTGGTTITSGILSIGDSSTTGSVVGNIVDDSNLGFNHSNAYTFSGVISGTGTVTQNGPGVLKLNGNNTYSGFTFLINGGTLVAANSHAFGTSQIFLESGTELRSQGAITLANKIVFISTTGAIFSAASGSTLTLGGKLDVTNTAALTFGSKGNTGIVAIAGPVTEPTAIPITVAFGTLENGGNLSGLTSTASTVTVNTGATLALDDLNTTISVLAGSGAVTLGKNASTVLTIASNFGVAGFAGVISGKGQVNLDATSSTDLYLLDGTNTYTGGTTITKGVFAIGNGGTTGSIAGNVTDDGKLLFFRSNAYTFGGTISGTGVVEVTAGGVITLSGNNTYSGGTSVTTGTLVAANSHALGTGAVVLRGGTELRGQGKTTLANTVSFLAPGTDATISAASGSTFTLGGTLDVTNAGVLTFGSKGNTGTVAVGGSVTVPNTPTVTVAFGTLENGGGLGALTSAATSVTVNTGATLAVNDMNMTIGNLQGGGAFKTGVSAGTTVTLHGGNFSGVISGAGRFLISGSLTLSGANTYTGTTDIASGTTLVNDTTGSATGTGSVVIGAATLGGSGTIKGPMLLEGGTIAPSTGGGTAGTVLHGSSLLWDSGTLQFQIGAKADELLLSGALTKNTPSPFDIDILAANGGSTIPTGTYTLLKFASTTFAQSDFTLQLPVGISGNLLETKNALELQITHNEFPHAESVPSLADISSAPADSDLPTSTLSTNAPTDEFTALTPTPEPGSALLLACGGTLLLVHRRRRRDIRAD
jgi:autotransporter-associated beta strand protein/predicted outer membrane repeat protein